MRALTAGAVALENEARSAGRSLLAGRPRDRLAAWIALASVALFAWGEVAGLSALLRAAEAARAQLPGLRVELLLERLLRGGYAAAAFLLVLGSLTTAVSTLFLSEEIAVRVALPIPHRRILFRQVAITIATASAPTLLIALPALGVLARASRHPALALGAASLSFLALVLGAGLTGTALALLLVRIVPPRRARLLAAFLSAVGLAAALVGLRTARPERLLDPIAAVSVLTALGETPLAPPGLDPLARAANICARGLVGERAALGEAFALCGIVGLAVLAVSLVMAPLHLHVYREAREADTPARGARARRRPVTSLWSALVRAETATLLRDASTPAQLGSLAAVFLLDLLNVRLLPAGDLAERNLVAGLQAGLALFLVSALALRFAYPSVSSDGRSALVLRTLPLSPARHLWARYLVRGLPAVLISVILIGASDAALHPAPSVAVISLLVAVVGGVTIPALHLGLGALFPRYDAPNAISVALGPGGLFALTLSTGLSLAATLVVSAELRDLLTVLAHTRASGGATMLIWSLAAVLAGALPLWLAVRAAGKSDLASG